MIELSVVILTYNQRDFTLRCLESIKPLMADDRYEVILVDNGSTDGTRSEVEESYKSVKYLYQNKNLGVAAGRNVGLREARGKKLMLLDNDTIVPSGAIEALSAYLDGHPEVGLVAPRLESPDGRLQKSWKEFPGIFRKICNVMTRGKSSHYSETLPDSEIEPFYVIGAAQLFTRDVLDKCGELDENIFYGPEDADFCIRVRKAGKKVVYNPKVMIIHDWQRVTTGKIFSPMGRKHMKGLLYFYLKHRRL